MAVVLMRPQTATGAVTAAPAASPRGRACRIRKSRLDLAVVRSLARGRRGDVHGQPRPGRAGDRLEGAPGPGRAAGGRDQLRHRERGDRQAGGAEDALAMAAETASLLGIDPEQVLVLSTGVIGAKLPMPKLLAGLGQIEVSPDCGATRRRRSSPPTRLPRKRSCGARASRSAGWRRRGDDPPVPRDDARGRHHRLPAGGRRGARLPQARGQPELQQISVDGECSTNDAVILLANGESGVERTTATDVEFAAALGEVCADLAQQIVSDARARPSCSRSRSRAPRPPRGDRDRAPDRHLAARQDRRVRP